MLKLLTAALTASACLVATSASAATVLGWNSNQVGLTQTTDFGGIVKEVPVDGLSAQIAYTLQSVSNDTWTFGYSVANTSGAPIDTSRVSGFGFNVDPDVQDASATGVFNIDSSGAVPMLGKFELCFLAGGGGQCAGGGGGGVQLGDTGAGTFTLKFASAHDAISLSDLFVRYQSINSSELGVSGGSGVGVGEVVSAVPEPTTWGLMIAGFTSAGLMLRTERRRQRLAA